MAYSIKMIFHSFQLISIFNSHRMFGFLEILHFPTGPKGENFSWNFLAELFKL